AVTPDHGSGEGSVNETSTVSPILKSSTSPSERHEVGVLRKPSRNATAGTVTIAAAIAAAITPISVRNVLRFLSCGSSTCLSVGEVLKGSSEVLFAIGCHRSLVAPNRRAACLVRWRGSRY